MPAHPPSPWYPHRALQTLLVLAAVAAPGAALGDIVRVPLTLSHGFLESLLREQAFTGAGDSLRMNDDRTGCQYLELENPRVTTRNGQLQLLTSAAARAGRALGGQCLLVLDWRGQLEFTQQAVVGPDGRSVLLRISSWRALRPDGSPDNVSTTIGRWIEQFLPFGLKQTRVDLDAPLDQLGELLGLMLTADDRDRAEALIATIAVDSVAAGDDGATVVLRLDAPLAPPVAPPSEPALSPAELAELEKRLDELDAFVTYTVKSVSREKATDLESLLTVLLGLRHEVLDILRSPERPLEDPVRTLFVDAWGRLVPILDAVAAAQPDYEHAMRYIAFIGAGDALEALDGLGPAAGIEISRDGLRRLARILIPDDPADPLERDERVDAELRRTFGFGEPIPPPEPYDETSWIDWLVPKAYAAAPLDHAAVRRLNNWVPAPRDMSEYLPMVRDVLRHVIAEQLRARALDGAYHDVYFALVLAAAWQESCWRQFVAKDDKRVPMQSGSGDIGMMQINPKVWRGFYDLQGLRWDIVYNARAGADILEHHLTNYAIGRGEQRHSGGSDNLARASYAAYNGGPRAYDRYRRADAPARGKQIDTLFYEKYRAIRRGEELAVTACYQ